MSDTFYITCSKGEKCLVDEDMCASLSRWKWHVGATGLVCRIGWELGKRKRFFIHSTILPPPPGLFVDHINRNSLDNRRINLRFATRQQNNWNRKKPKNGTSRFKGVSWYKNRKLWVAKIKEDGNQKTLGYFKDERHAAMAYDREAVRIQGNFAVINLPNEIYV